MEAVSNCYAPPLASLANEPCEPVDVLAPEASTALRLQHLRHEAALVGLGQLLIVSAACSWGAWLYGLTVFPVEGAAMKVGIWLLGQILYVHFVFCVLLGILLWTRSPQARPLALAFACIRMVNLPTGPIFGLYAAWLTQCAAGRFVLSSAHEQLRRRTRAIKVPLSLFGLLAGLLSPLALLALVGGIGTRLAARADFWSSVLDRLLM